MDAMIPGVTIDISALSLLKPSNRKTRLPQKAFAPKTGRMMSRAKGRGMDFAEVRIYEPGDDIRNIDWRVTARTGKPHTKLFQEEKERPVYFLVDQRPTMFFGSTECFKSVSACQTAARLAWRCLADGDRIGGLVFSHQDMQHTKPNARKAGIQHFFHILVEYNQALLKTAREPLQMKQNQQGFNVALEHLQTVAKPGSLVIIVSDFNGFDRHSDRHIAALTKHNRLLAYFIFDPLESSLPVDGTYWITDGLRPLELNTQDRDFQMRFKQHFHQHLKQVRDTLTRYGGILIERATGQGLDNL